MSPRRSSRARTTQPPPSVATAHSTSSSSVASGRTDRAPRVNQNQSPPHKSSTPHSLSSEEPEEPPRGSQVGPPLTRRRTREQDNDEDDSAKLDDELDDDMVEEDEVTRCVCGYQEYPGPPSDVTKSGSVLTGSEAQGDDLGGLFIQCDICKVWQHGGCVGIMDEAASPEEYFCEECRKDLHKVMKSNKGCVMFSFSPSFPTQVRFSLWTVSALPDQRQILEQPSLERTNYIGRNRMLTRLSLQSKVLPLPPRLRATIWQESQIVRFQRHRETLKSGQRSRSESKRRLVWQAAVNDEQSSSI